MRKPVPALIDSAVHLHADTREAFRLCPADSRCAAAALLEATNAMEHALDALRLARNELDLAEKRKPAPRRTA